VNRLLDCRTGRKVDARAVGPERRVERIETRGQRSGIAGQLRCKPVRVIQQRLGEAAQRHARGQRMKRDRPASVTAIDEDQQMSAVRVSALTCAALTPPGDGEGIVNERFSMPATLVYFHPRRALSEKPSSAKAIERIAASVAHPGQRRADELRFEPLELAAVTGMHVCIHLEARILASADPPQRQRPASMKRRADGCAWKVLWSRR